jgi:hypothetical protein
VEVFLIDGTYELFRHYYALPPAKDADGREVGAVRGVVQSVLAMITGGARYVGVATDHVIESFRNDLWPGYKTGAGIEPDLYAQFPLLEEALAAAGITVWPMTEFEADDALASAAAIAARDTRVDRVVICTPDRIWRSASRARVSCRPTGGRGQRSTKQGSTRSSACRRRRYPTISRWLATPRTAIPDFAAGGRSRRQPCSHDSGTSKPFLPSPPCGL